MSDPEKEAAWEKLVEPEAVDAWTLNRSETIQISIAISMKRIADVLTGPVNHYGENLPEAIAGGIARALQEDRAWRK